MNKKANLLRLMAVLASFSLLAVLAACGDDDDSSSDSASADGEEMQEVDYLLPYQDSMSFLGLMVAKADGGCLEQEGIQLNTQPSEGSDFVLQQLIAGNVKFGQTGADNILIANAQGRDVRGIAQVGGRGVFTIVAPTDSDVTSVEDLDGQKLGVTDLGGGEIPLVRAAIADAGLTEGDDVELVVVGPGGPASFNAIESGEIAAYAGANNDIAGMIAAGLESESILSEEFQNVPTTEVAMMQETLDNEEDRETAITIARCYREGSEFALENPEEARDISCEIAPEECEDPAVTEAYLQAVLDTLFTPEGAEHYTEHLPVEAFDLVQTSLAADDIAEPQDLEEVFPNEYLDAINEPLTIPQEEG